MRVQVPIFWFEGSPFQARPKLGMVDAPNIASREQGYETLDYGLMNRWLWLNCATSGPNGSQTAMGSYMNQLGALSHPLFGWKASPTKIDVLRKSWAPCFLTSEDLV